MWSGVWVQVAGLTRCSVPSEVTWEEEVILMPSQCYWYIVTSETGVRWVGATPLGAFTGSRRSWCAHTHTNRYSHPPCELTKPSLTHRLKWPPRGEIAVPLVANVALKQAREISRLSEKEDWNERAGVSTTTRLDLAWIISASLHDAECNIMFLLLHFNQKKKHSPASTSAKNLGHKLFWNPGEKNCLVFFFFLRVSLSLSLSHSSC